jgi:signal transduction histidine kinase
MSGTGPQFAPQPPDAGLPKSRSALSHLLHALNQPLTGLQCSLELALVGPRLEHQYIHTMREGLELTSRMRLLVEAIRELADAPQRDGDEIEPLELDALLRDAAEDLLPAAETKGVRILVVSPAPLPVAADRRAVATLLFRLLESALSLAREGSEVRIAAEAEAERAHLGVSWNPGPLPEHSPFSRQELGLVIAQTGWERAGAEWARTREGTTETCSISMPLAFSAAAPDRAER